VKVSRSVVAAFALAAGLSGVARADVLTIDMNQYGVSVDTTPNQTLAVLTVTDIVGGVSVDLSLTSLSSFIASTGGPHITLAFNVDKTLNYNEFTFTDAPKSDFTFETAFNAGSTFGTFTDGIDGTWSGTSNDLTGPIDFTITLTGLTTGDFGSNAKNYWAIADVFGPAGTGEIGGKVGMIGPSIPEASTWAMMAVGFAGLGFAGYRRTGGVRLASL
jgi:hypothetical protein